MQLRLCDFHLIISCIIIFNQFLCYLFFAVILYPEVTDEWNIKFL